ncbi:MAG: rod shape-determining protein RodA [Candidatus Omnitrophica bacterium]|nr:rod shape-determining protein RodA [Candidatus Omnitrophota bacterium]
MKTWDKYLLSLAAALVLCSMFTLLSASQHKQTATGKNFVASQLVWVGAGAVIVAAIHHIGHPSILSFAYLIYGISLILLMAVLVGGSTALGAQRWLKIGFITIQPSEFAKLGTIVMLARVIADRPERVKTLRGFALPLLTAALPMLMIFKQPDLGTSLVFVPVVAAMLFVAGMRSRYFIGALFIGLALLPVGWHLLHDYQKDRVMVFVKPDRDPLGAGYTINQSKIAIGSGRLFGKGWNSGTQNQLDFLPERHSDFIFSVIGEEWGFAGTSFVLTVFLLLLLRGLRIAETTQELSGRLLAVGVTTMVAAHVIMNIGMTIGLMPVVGIPLPLVSYGGSAMISNMMAIGFLQSVQARRILF